jgi:hypothetical protein
MSEKEINALLEEFGDRLEEAARSLPEWSSNPKAVNVFGLAWDLKQEARKGTASEGL